MMKKANDGGENGVHVWGFVGERGVTKSRTIVDERAKNDEELMMTTKVLVTMKLARIVLFFLAFVF